MKTLSMTIAAAAFALFGAFAAAPASAGDHGHGWRDRGHHDRDHHDRGYDDRGWRDNGWHRGHHKRWDRPVYVAPRPVFVVPPPAPVYVAPRPRVVYEPAPVVVPPSSFNLVVPLTIR